MAKRTFTPEQITRGYNAENASLKGGILYGGRPFTVKHGEGLNNENT